jgi:hypothetical protein
LEPVVGHFEQPAITKKSINVHKDTAEIPRDTRIASRTGIAR